MKRPRSYRLHEECCGSLLGIFGLARKSLVRPRCTALVLLAVLISCQESAIEPHSDKVPPFNAVAPGPLPASGSTDTVMFVSWSGLVGLRHADPVEVISELSIDGKFHIVLGISPTQPVAYVGGGPLSQVTAVNTLTQTVVAVFGLPPNLRGPAFSPDGRFAYFASQHHNSVVSVVETTGHSIVDQIPIAGGPAGVVVTPDGRRVYVALQVGRAVAVVETATNSVLTTIPVGGFAQGIAVSPDGSAVYVATFEGLYRIDVASNTAVNFQPNLVVSAVAIAPDGRVVYTNPSTQLAAIDVSTGVVRTATPFPEGRSALDLATSPDGALVYATIGTRQVFVIDASTLQQVSVVSVRTGPRRVAAAVLPANLLSVTLAGNGSVVSQPSGIECPSHCVEDFLPFEEIRLLPIHPPGTVFGGWSGDCSGTAGCVVAMTSDRAVVAAFFTAQELLQQLIAEVIAFQFNTGIKTALIATLEAALTSLENDRPAAIKQLNAFINQVEAFRGPTMPDAAADELIDRVQEIVAAIQALP